MAADNTNNPKDGGGNTNGNGGNDYRDSVLLPKTAFPMKASLAEREPKQIEAWQASRVYEQMIARNEKAERYVFHDGPPYANGHIHYGHILNKVLKDMVVKYANMSGKLCEFIPGWDCHGLPIELKTEEGLGSKKREMSKVEIRQACRAYAQKFVDIQREEFKRIGVFARWDEPYLTMNYGYEADIVRQLAAIAEGGYLMRGKKPVYWCIKDHTALAEAEVEYEDHTSPSIYVAFPLVSPLPEGKLAGQKIELVIWTTTPWTLPANLAIAVHPEVTYVAYELDDSRVVIVAKDLLSAFLTAIGAAQFDPSKILATFQGKELEGLSYRHVLNGRENPVILGEHVTTETGTGLVHTAPGHGAEDFDVGRKYCLDVFSPVDGSGRYTEEAGDWLVGMQIFEANPKIIEKLVEIKALLSDPTASITHSYPCCWRCKRPVIFRATPQWFISMAHRDLRQRALDEVEKVQWIPKWGKNRIHGMLAARPDWCVSRQRAWGVPIPVFYCDACDEAVVDSTVMHRVADVFDEEGADAWFARPAEDFLGKNFKCPKCGGTHFHKENDILDVWFDSGASFAAVAGREPHLGLPVDLYLEGADQHRGWFHSTLLIALMTRGEAPYRSVLTHGFVVDGQGKKMSKSIGNFVSPEKNLKELGAEILRLWVAASDYRDDIRVSPQILTGMTESYRKLRNTFRYALGNLADFDPSADSIDESQMLPIDRWALARMRKATIKIREAYESANFHVVFHTAVDLCAVDLSAIYFDVLKDRLYTAGKRSLERRSAQSALHSILMDLLRLLAPMLSFTCEEAYGHLPHKKENSVFLTGMPKPTPTDGDEAILAEFEKLFAIRAEVQKALEQARQNKLIGSSLEAAVTLTASGAAAELLERNLGQLEALFIVSKVSVKRGEDGDLSVDVTSAPGTKCPRCWTYSEAIDANHPVCPKCAKALA
ncbi:MAG: isoleucine--tRNA ligase [Myxococcales bacterium]|jgi:isoleucyl-tRNA synthetase|nr:isoleucine--tRNA ligase [Myxococcales bacterium]